MLPVHVTVDEQWAMHQLRTETARSEAPYAGNNTLVNASLTLPVVPEGELWLIDRLTVALTGANESAPVLVYVEPNDGSENRPWRTSPELSARVDGAGMVKVRDRQWVAVFADAQPMRVPEQAQLVVCWEALPYVTVPATTIRWALRAEIRVLRRR